MATTRLTRNKVPSLQHQVLDYSYTGSFDNARATFISHYCGKTIGKGGYNEVFRMKPELDTQYLLRIPLYNDKPRHTQLHDAELHHYLASRFPELVPQIFGIYEVVYNNHQQSFIVQVVEFVDACGLKCRNPFPGMTAVDSYVVRMLKAAVAMANGGINHGDINAGNIVMTTDGARLLDFDETCVWNGVEEFQCKPSRSNGFSLSFQSMPPEMLCKEEARLLGYKVQDYWRLAAVINTMIFLSSNVFSSDDNLSVFREMRPLVPALFTNIDTFVTVETDLKDSTKKSFTSKPGLEVKAQVAVEEIGRLKNIMSRMHAFYERYPCSEYTNKDMQCGQAYIVFMCAMLAMTTTATSYTAPWRHRIHNPDLMILVFDCLHPIPNNRPNALVLESRLDTIVANAATPTGQPAKRAKY